jgi:hypothetical protein
VIHVIERFIDAGARSARFNPMLFWIFLSPNGYFDGYRMIL